MKKVIYFIVAALICSCSNESYTLTGEAQGVVAGDSIMICSYHDSSVRYAATAVSEDNTFTLSGKIDKPTVAALVINDRSLIGIFFLEAGKISLVASEESGVVFSGSESNDAYAAYIATSTAIEDSYINLDPTMEAAQLAVAQKAIYEEYVGHISSTIDANLDNLLGAYIFANDEFTILEASAAKERLDQFAPQILEELFMADLAEAVSSMLRTEVGEPYIDVQLTTTDGKSVAISELLAQGKYVLIDFWATWCGPCVAELPHLKAAYKAYKNHGFEIYGISLDRDQNSWMQMVDKTMPWVNVIDSAEVGAAESYAIRTIPSNFLISPEGIIVAKNLRGELIESALEEHLDQ